MGKDRRKDDVAKSALHVRGGVDGGHDGLPGQASRGEAGTGARRPRLAAQEYVDGVCAGDRVVLARAITLIESSAPAHRQLAQQVLAGILPHCRPSVRIGITGIPGAGKSTLIEDLGTRLTGAGHKVAVTAVDPTSSLTGGSVLGDKTRMEKLATDPDAFIRPSPSSGTLGGVARKTRETVMLFEAAGYDIILIETMGVGQSEVMVRSMADFFLLVLIAGAGDELQGLKKGVVEIADAILINKADGQGTAAAERTRSQFEQVLHFLRPATVGWTTRALTASALSGDGVEELWQVIQEFVTTTRAGGAFAARRAAQERAWLHSLVAEGLREMFRVHPGVAAATADLEEQVVRGALPATTAADRLLGLFQGED